MFKLNLRIFRSFWGSLWKFEGGVSLWKFWD